MDARILRKKGRQKMKTVNTQMKKFNASNWTKNCLEHGYKGDIQMLIDEFPVLKKYILKQYKARVSYPSLK